MPTFFAAKITGQLSVIALYGALCLCFRLSSVGFLYGFKLAGARSILDVGAIFASNMDILNTIPACFTSRFPVSFEINQSCLRFIRGLAYAYLGGFDKMHGFINRGVVNSES